MIKFFLLIFIFFIKITFVNAEIVKSISIKGNERITDNTIIVFSKISIGNDIAINEKTGTCTQEISSGDSSITIIESDEFNQPEQCCSGELGSDPEDYLSVPLGPEAWPTLSSTGESEKSTYLSQGYKLYGCASQDTQIDWPEIQSSVVSLKYLMFSKSLKTVCATLIA